MIKKVKDSIFCNMGELFKDLNFKIKIELFRIRKRYGWLLGKILEHSSFFRRIIILIISLALARIIIGTIDLPNFHFYKLADNFNSIGVMIGGMFAIILALSIFVLQNASDLYSSQFYEVYIHDKLEKYIYSILIVIALLFFTAGIIFKNDLFFITSSVMKKVFIYLFLFFTALIFILIDIQYENSRRKANPIKALEFLEYKSIEFLNNIQKDIIKIVKIVKLKDQDSSEELIKAIEWNKYPVQHLPILNRQIENLSEITIKLSDRQEIKTANRGLKSINNILLKYLDLRKDCSLAYQSKLNFLVTESDSQSFLSKNIEGMYNLGKKFIEENKIENAVYVFDIFISLANKSKEIKFLNTKNKNPIFSLIIGYFKFLIEFSIREKNQEVGFQGIRVLDSFILIVFNNKLMISLSTIYEDLLAIALFGISEKNTAITDKCQNVYLGSLTRIFKCQLIDADRYAEKTLENIKNITVNIYQMMIKGFLPNNISTSFTLTKPYEKMINYVYEIVNNYKELKDGKTKESYKKNIVGLFDKIYRFLRDLAEKIQNCDNILNTYIGFLIFDLDSLLIDLIEDKEFESSQEKLIEILGKFVYLPSWFFLYDKTLRKSNNLNSNELIEAVTKTGLKLFRSIKNDDSIIEIEKIKLLKDCVESLYDIAENSIEKIKEDYGYDEPRVMLKLCFLGVLGLKNDVQPIIIEVKKRICEFEKIYKEKYFSGVSDEIISENICGPKKEQLLIELLRWHRNFINHKYETHRLMDSSEDRMFELIDEKDIERFIHEVWNYTFPKKKID